MKKVIQFGVRLEAATKKKLEKAAKMNRRTLSNQARILIEDGLDKELKEG